MKIDGAKTKHGNRIRILVLWEPLPRQMEAVASRVELGGKLYELRGISPDRLTLTLRCIE